MKELISCKGMIEMTLEDLKDETVDKSPTNYSALHIFSPDFSHLFLDLVRVVDILLEDL